MREARATRKRRLHAARPRRTVQTQRIRRNATTAPIALQGTGCLAPDAVLPQKTTVRIRAYPRQKLV